MGGEEKERNKGEVKGNGGGGGGHNFRMSELLNLGVKTNEEVTLREWLFLETVLYVLFLYLF